MIDNGRVEAAAFVYNEDELDAFDHRSDRRPKTWLVMDRTKACELTGYVDEKQGDAADASPDKG